MADTTDTQLQDDRPPQAAPKERRSSLTKIVDAIKKPFQQQKKEKENPPALQEAIDKMEARKHHTEDEMREQGKDPALLSTDRKDIAKNAI